MANDEYKAAMDELKFSEDFEKRTLDKLASAMTGKTDATGGKQRRRPGLRGIGLRWAMGAGAGIAAAIVLTMALRIAPSLVSGGLPTNETARGNLVKIGAQIGVKDEYGMVDQAGTAAAGNEGGAVGASDATADAQADAYNLPVTEATAGEAAILPIVPESEGGPAALPGLAEDAEDEYVAIMPDTDSAQPLDYQAHSPTDTSEYAYIQENGFLDVSLQPLSTFAADVDTASYANVRRMLLEGRIPPPDAVRTEAFLNYFAYDYPAPKEGEPFSVTTEIAPCPWNPEAQLLLVGLKAKDIEAQALPASNLVFLIDVSGSMDEPDKLPLAQSAFQMLIAQLRPEDRVSIVTYAGSERVVLDGASGADKLAISQAVDSLMASGSTNGEGGIMTAYALAQKHFIKEGNNRVILASDGDFNVGVSSESELIRLIEEKKQGGVFLSVMGFGTGNLKDNHMEALADHGNGNYHYVDSRLEARKVLVEQMGANLFTVCKDVKLQLEFNPAKVAKYRLIGYENRVMAAQDFADDQKDGGEIGAGHSVTAIYELVLADDDVEPGEGDGLKYQSSRLTPSDEYLTVSIRAKDPDGEVSRQYDYPVDGTALRGEPSDNLAFAAAVAQTCMLLRDSEYKGSASYAGIAEQLDKIQGIVKDPYKDEFAYMVRTLARGR